MDLLSIMQDGFKIRDQSLAHFLTFTVVDWIDVFSRELYREILLRNIKFCQDHKGLILNAWCLMSNHLHLIARASNKNLSDVIRDLKKYTSKEIVSAIKYNHRESRREWMIDLFEKNGKENSRNKDFQFWKQDNHPEELFGNDFITTKINYIHANPVKNGLVDCAEHYRYSSARDYFLGKKVGLLDVEWI